VIRFLILFTAYFLSFIPGNVHAQAIGEWTAYTSFRSVNDLTQDQNGKIWAATTGGVITFQDGAFADRLTSVEGLSDLNGISIAFDEATSRVFVGYESGTIDIINTETFEITVLSDISRVENFDQKRINSFFLEGRELFVATDFGIVIYDLDNLLVKDSFTKVGSFTRGISVFDIKIFEGNLYAGTQEGIGIGDLNQNLLIEENWTNFDESNGFVSRSVQSIAVTGNFIFASTTDENYEFDGAEWTLSNRFTSGPIISYERRENVLWAVDSDQVYKLENGELTSRNLNNFEFQSFTVNSESVIAGTLNNGLLFMDLNLQNETLSIPPGPFQNFFEGLNISDGTLIAGSTSKSSFNSNIDRGKGYYILKDNQWKNFNSINNDVIRAKGYRQSFRSAANEEFYYFGSWGRGIARHDIETDEITIFDETNSVIRGWEDDDPLFPVISGVATDSNGDVWITSRFGSNPLYYQQLGTDEWLSFSKSSTVSFSDEYVGLFIDSFDQKWITLQSTSLNGRGLLILNTGNPEDPSDDTGVKLTEDENNGFLPNPKVNAIIQDKNDEVWIGTDRGIGRFIFPDLIIDGGPQERRAQFLINEDTSAASRILLRDANVTAMAVNGANQKWIGSATQGVWLINAEGSRILKRFTETNSPLFSDNIISIAVNDETGEVFFATDRGLISFTDVPTGPISEMDDLKVYPNPFRYDRHSTVTIEGLSDESLINVVGTDGMLVKRIQAQGGRASWDGKDFNGSRLGSGVYFVIALDENGGEKGIGKVVIIR